MKRRLLLGLMCLSVVFFVSCTTALGPPIYDDPTKPIEVGVNEEFVVAIDYEPTTEYFWTEQYDNSALELVESTCLLCTVGELETTPYTAFRPSGGAANFSRFKALRKGETEITMVFKRPLEDNFIEQKVFTVVVK